MPRHLLIGLLISACGNDIEGVRGETETGSTGPDGGPVDAGTIVLPDGKIVAIDAGSDPDAAIPLTECEEATLHSDLAWIQDHVLTPSCATSTCHAGASPDVGLSLELGRSHVNLVNRNTSTVTGWRRVVPGQVAQSYLVVALGRAAGPEPRDGFMPLGAEPLCVEKLEAIERWIAAGAQP